MPNRLSFIFSSSVSAWIPEQHVLQRCKNNDRRQHHSLCFKSPEQNAILTCILPFSSNLPLLFPPVKQLIDSKYFFCKRSFKFIPLDNACDGKDDCAEGEDEITCVSNFKVNTTFPGKTNKWLFFCFIITDKAWKMTPLALLSVPFFLVVRLMTEQQVLQVYSRGPGWRSVCSDDWTEKHTQTACKQLGYT